MRPIGTPGDALTNRNRKISEPPVVDLCRCWLAGMTDAIGLVREEAECCSGRRDDEQPARRRRG